MAEQDTPKSKPNPVSDEELRIAFSGPALFSNKFWSTVGPYGIRLAFAEGSGPKVPPQFRAAVVLSFLDALELRDLLVRQLEKVRIELEPEEVDGQKKG